MKLSSSALVGFLFTLLPANAEYGHAGCKAKYSSVGSRVSKCSEAQRYCSSHYPAKRVTSTVVAPTCTKTVTATSSKSVPGSTVTVTQTSGQTQTSSTTSTTTITSTLTTTTTTMTTTVTVITPPAMRRKREEHLAGRNPEPECNTHCHAVWSSIECSSKQHISDICSCMESTPTLRITSTPHQTTTVTTTQTIVANPTTTTTTVTKVVTTITTTIIISTTTTTTSTSTYTSTSTSTTMPAQVTCNASQVSFCSTNGGQTDGAYPCTDCGVLFSSDSPTCFDAGDGFEPGNCYSDYECSQRDQGISAVCIYNPNGDGSTGCAINNGCNSIPMS
ncbi:hypothetical protein BST61_g155 [Cercospora zeina]